MLPTFDIKLSVSKVEIAYVLLSVVVQVTIQLFVFTSKWLFTKPAGDFSLENDRVWLPAEWKELRNFWLKSIIYIDGEDWGVKSS